MSYTYKNADLIRSPDLISPNIQNYIEDKLKYLVCNPDYFLSQGTMKNKIEEESNRHSVSLELVNFNITKSESLKAKTIEKRRCQKSLNLARNWAKENYSLPLTFEFIRDLGMRVDPFSNPTGYREGNVKIAGSRVSPPSKVKLDRELRIFLWENEGLRTPLEKALHAHFNLGRIHAFEDGNGRTSRLVQDTILSQEGLPLPMIGLFERSEYIQKIESAAFSYSHREANFSQDLHLVDSRLKDLAWNYRDLNLEEIEEGRYLAKYVLNNKVTSEQNSFYDFLALKILNGLSENLKRLYPSEKAMKTYLKKKKYKSNNKSNNSKSKSSKGNKIKKEIRSQNRRSVYTPNLQFNGNLLKNKRFYF